MTAARRVLITGMGLVAPSGVTVERFWDEAMAGRVHIEDEPLMARLGLRCRGVARCREFDPGAGWPAAEAAELSRLGRFAQLGATAARDAMADAGLAEAGAGPRDGAVLFASAVGGAPEMQELYERLTGGGRSPIRPAELPASAYDGIFLDFLPGWLAARYGMEGPTAALTTGCTAGLDAVALGHDLVRHGDAPFVLAGASDCPLNGISYATLDVIGCLSRCDGPVERASRPFDLTRAGFVIAEGAAFVVLEEAGHARARGARPYAEVLGAASTCGAHHMTDLDAGGAAMAATLEGALADAGVEPDEVDYVSAHGSSTPQNDLFETNALKAVLGPRAGAIPVSSLKSMIGHSLASASLLALIATVGAVRRSLAPPTANYAFPDPACDLDYVTAGARPCPIRTALVMASGFGGIHTAAVIREAA
jgi:3-oxoacyl-(acyl-carrier-protein) synthase